MMLTHFPVSTHPISQIVSQYKVPRKGLCKSFVKVQNFQELFPIDQMNITISQRTNVGYSLANICRLFPEAVSKNVTFA